MRTGEEGGEQREVTVGVCVCERSGREVYDPGRYVNKWPRITAIIRTSDGCVMQYYDGRLTDDTRAVRSACANSKPNDL